MLSSLCPVCVILSTISLDTFVNAPAGVASGERPHKLPSAVLALVFIARRVQPSLSFVDLEVEFCVPTTY